MTEDILIGKCHLDRNLYRFGLIFTFGENNFAGHMWPEGGRLDTPGQVSQQNIFMEKVFEGIVRSY